MAKQWTPPSTDSIVEKTKSTWTPPETDSIVNDSLKKKVESKDSKSGSESLNSGGSGDLRFPTSTPKPIAPTPLTPVKQEEFKENIVKPYVAKKEALSQSLNKANNVYKAVQGKKAFDEIQSYVAKRPEDTLAEPQEQSFTESVTNTGKNIGNRLEGFIPRLKVVSADVWEKVLGKELAGKFYDLENRDLDEERRESYMKLDQLAQETEYTQGIVGNIQNFDAPRLAAGVVDAMGSIVSTAIPAVLTGGAGLFTDMAGESIVNFNEAKAKAKGVSVDKLYESGDAEFGVPFTLGVISGGLELVGLKGVQSAMTKNLKGSALKRAAIMFTDVNKEGLTEWLQTGIETANLATAEGKSSEEIAKAVADAMLSKKGLESYVMGMVGSGASSIAGRYSKKVYDRALRKEVETLEQTQESTMKDIANPNITPEIKEELIDVLVETQSKINSAVKKDDSLHEKLNEDQKAKIQKLDEQASKLEAIVNDELVSKETKSQIQAKLDSIKEKIAEIVPDTEASLTKEFQEAEKAFKEDGDQTAFDNKMAEIEARVQQLPENQIKAEEAKQETVGETSQEVADNTQLGVETTEQSGNIPEEVQGSPVSQQQEATTEMQGIGDGSLEMSREMSNANQKEADLDIVKSTATTISEKAKSVVDAIKRKFSSVGYKDYSDDTLASTAAIELEKELPSKVYFHGTDTNIDQVDLSEVGKRDFGNIGSGFYISKSPRMSQAYAEEATKKSGKDPLLKSIIVNSDNFIDANEANNIAQKELGITFPTKSKEEATKVRELILGLGYDGVVLADGKEIAVFNPKVVQIGQTYNGLKDLLGINKQYNEQAPTPTEATEQVLPEQGEPQAANVTVEENDTIGNDTVISKSDTVIDTVTKSKRELATEARKAAKAKLDALNVNLSIANDPKEKAKAFFDYHVALVTEAKEYISEGMVSVQDFATVLGEKVTKVVQDAWDEATGASKKVLADFEEDIKPKEAFTDEELSVMGITKKEAKRIREEIGEEQYEYEVKSRATLIAEAERVMKEGYDVPNLIKRVDKGYIPKDYEIELIRQYYVSLSARINKEPTPELLTERKELLATLDRLKTTAGRTVQAFDGLIAVEDNLATFLEEEGKYYDLTQEEIKDLTEKYNKAQEALAKLAEKTEKAKKNALDKQAQRKIDEARKAQSRNAAIKENFREERKKLIEDVRAELKRIRATPSAIVLPYTRELIVIAPFVKKMVESHVREGIHDLKTIVKNIHAELKDDIDGLQEDDIRDVIAGEYPNPRNTKNAKLAQVRDLETQAKLERKIEELEQGIIESKSPSKKKVKSDEILNLEKRIKEIKKRNPELSYPSKLQSRKTWYETKINELKSEISKGDFDPIEPPYPVLLDDEALRLKDEYIKFREETRIRREKKDYEALSEIEKNLKKLRELAEIKRVVQTSLDVSIPLRQGVSVMLNPRTMSIGIQGYSKMLNTMFSEIKYKRLMYDIENNPEFLRSKDDGIVYTDLGSDNIELRDESHPVRGFIHRIPFLGKGIEISARAAAAWANFARFELYQRGVKTLLAEGKTRENSKQAYEDMAARVMVDTGRGKIPFLSDNKPSAEGTLIKQALGTVFYGARLYSATFRKLNPLYFFNPKVDKTVRIEALKDMSGYVASQIIAHTALALALGASISFDYDEPDFMKLRIGKRVLDLTAGQSVYIRTFLRLVHASFNRFDPTVNKTDADKYAEFAKKSVLSFWRNKLAPNTSYALNAFSGTNSIGEKFDPYEIIKIYPMYTDDVVNAFKEGSPLDALFIIPVGVSGLGYQEYSKDIKRARVSVYLKESDTEVKSLLKKHQLNITGDINQEIFDYESGTNVKMTKEQSNTYEKIWAEHIISTIKRDKDELERLANLDKKHVDEKGYKKKLTSAIGAIKSEATQKAKEAISGIDPNLLEFTKEGQDYKLNSKTVKLRQNFKKEFMAETGNELIGETTIKFIEDKGMSRAEANRAAIKYVNEKANAESLKRLLEEVPLESIDKKVE